MAVDILETFLYSPLCLILANVGPSRLNAWNTALINGISIGDAQLKQHLPSDKLAIQHLGLDFFEDLLAKLRHLLDELGPQTLILNALHVLQVSLLLGRAHDREAIPVLEKVGDQPSDPILFLNGVRGTPLLSKGVLKVLLGCDGVVLLIYELKGKVSDHPEEGREVFGHVFEITSL